MTLNIKTRRKINRAIKKGSLQEFRELIKDLSDEEDLLGICLKIVTKIRSIKNKYETSADASFAAAVKRSAEKNPDQPQAFAHAVGCRKILTTMTSSSLSETEQSDTHYLAVLKQMFEAVAIPVADKNHKANQVILFENEDVQLTSVFHLAAEFDIESVLLIAKEIPGIEDIKDWSGRSCIDYVSRSEVWVVCTSKNGGGI